jgi:hypothetical protein
LQDPIMLNKTDRKLSSLKIPLNHEVVLYEKENMEGAYVILTGDIPNLLIYLFNDRTMSIIYRKKQTESTGFVEIFPIFPKGDSFKRILPIGHTVMKPEDFYDINFFIDSIKVPNGLKVTLHKNPIFPLYLERKYTYTADCSDTKFFPIGFDSKLISVFVEKV